jgi:hypothetical protein
VVIWAGFTVYMKLIMQIIMVNCTQISTNLTLKFQMTSQKRKLLQIQVISLMIFLVNKH